MTCRSEAPGCLLKMREREIEREGEGEREGDRENNSLIITY